MSPASNIKPLRNLYALSCLVVVIAALYFARSVLIPVVLAVLLTFLLTPVMLAVERRGLPRLPAAAGVVLMTLALLVATGLLVTRQLSTLMSDLPNHRESILAKVETLRAGASESWLSGFADTLNDVREAIGKSEGKPPQPVEIVQSQFAFAHSAVSPLAESLITGGLVFVLSFFMLISREELRNRLVRMWGTRRLLQATRAMDDAGGRIGRFLLMQLVCNVAFGVTYGLALWAMGVPYPFLGGFIGGLMRYVPFVGVWVAGAGPAMLTIALLPGWSHLVLVVVLTAVLEVVFAQLIEPIAFGRSIGVSEVALLIALAFWGWLWGVAGMILATPLTACMVVFAHHVPRLRFLARLLGDGPGLRPEHALYQRLVAKDAEEAGKLIDAYRADHEAEAVYGDLLLPAVRLAKLHRDTGELGPDEEAAIYQGVRDLLPAVPNEGKGDGAPVIGFSSGEAANELSLELFSRVLPRGVAFRVDSAQALTAEVIRQAHECGPSVIVLGTVERGGLREARLLVKRLRKECPKTRLLVGWWASRRLPAAARRRLIEAGADGVATSLQEAKVQLSGLMPVASQAKPREGLVKAGR